MRPYTIGNANIQLRLGEMARDNRVLKIRRRGILGRGFWPRNPGDSPSSFGRQNYNLRNGSRGFLFTKSNGAMVSFREVRDLLLDSFDDGELIFHMSAMENLI